MVYVGARHGIREFLTSRRARVTPGSVGLGHPCAEHGQDERGGLPAALLVDSGAVG